MKETTLEEEIKFDPSKIDLGLTEKAKEIIDYFKNNVIYVEDHIDNYDDWLNNMIIEMTYGFEHLEFRTCPVSFKFYHDKEEETKVLPFRVFLFNAIMWFPQIKFDPDKLSDDLIIPENQSTKIVPSYIKDFIDTYYVIPYRSSISNYYLNEVLSDCIYIMATLCHTFYKFLGLSMNIEVFMDLAKRIPEFDELLHFKLDEMKQPADIEKDAKAAADRQWNLILNDDKFNILKPLLATGSLKGKQFAEFDNVIGLKPDIDGNTIPYPINKNWITGEINEIPITFVNDIAGRKAAIINNEFMGSAGHLLILVATLCNEAKLSKRVKDCHSPNPVPITIKSKTHLRKLDGRYYRFAGGSEYKWLNSKEDESLIGETLWFRSPITCCSEDGRICEKCYGMLANINKNLYSVGTYAAFAVMMKVTQDLLSAKHMQDTNSNKIEFAPEFYNYLQLSATDVIVSVDNEDIDMYTLVINRNDIHSTNDDNVIVVDGKKKRKSRDDDDIGGSYGGEDSDSEGDDASSFKLDYYATKFSIVKNFYNKKGMEITEFEELGKKELFMHIDFVSKMKFTNVEPFGECFYINLEDVNYDEFIFMVDVENNELSKPLKQIQGLMDNKTHEGCSTYEEMAQKMLDLIIEAKNPGTSVQGEIIVRQLIRDAEKIMYRPDFSRLILPKDYKIMTINTALRKHPSITTSMSTPYLRYQLVSQMETFEKMDTSDMDSAFRETLEDLIYPVIKEY